MTSDYSGRLGSGFKAALLARLPEQDRTGAARLVRREGSSKTHFLAAARKLQAGREPENFCSRRRIPLGLPEQNKSGAARLVRREGSSKARFLAAARKLNLLTTITAHTFLIPAHSPLGRINLC
jgi:hypothetical protein